MSSIHSEYYEEKSNLANPGRFSFSIDEILNPTDFNHEKFLNSIELPNENNLQFIFFIP